MHADVDARGTAGGTDPAWAVDKDVDARTGGEVCMPEHQEAFDDDPVLYGARGRGRGRPRSATGWR